MSTPKPNLIVALDHLDQDQALKLVEELSRVGVHWFKIGLELYTKYGPLLVKQIKSLGHQIFLDLKLHDIPNTVEKATAAASELNVDLLTVHCAGGAEMLHASVRAAKGSSLAVVGVTVLTSLSDSDLQSPRQDLVQKMAQSAAHCGLAGVVCSGQDLMSESLKGIDWSVAHSAGYQPLFVTPGIRLKDDSSDDQKAIVSPQAAIQSGATHLVVGRSILNPKTGSPVEMAKKYLELCR